MKYKRMCLLATMLLSMVGLSIVVDNNINLNNIENHKLLADSNEEIWNHYDQIEPTETTRGIREYWVSCDTHEHRFDAPSSGHVTDCGAPEQSFIDSLDDNDDRLVNPYSSYLKFSLYDNNSYYVIKSSSFKETNVIIPRTHNGLPVVKIGMSAFYNCSSLTSITIPDSVTSIEGSAFLDCERLTSINIPNGVTSIGNFTFNNCKKLNSINIPNGVTLIGSSAFSYCSSLTSITIPDSVTSIGTYAFYKCNLFSSITIPSSVVSIGDYAFYNCSSLTNVFYGGTKEQWDSIVIGIENNYLLKANIIYQEE